MAERRGQTLIEVVMATMIAAMTTTAVFSVILSSFVSGSKADKRDDAAAVLRGAQQVLNSYVTALPNDPAYSAGSPTGRWSADASGVWALRTGVHDISSLLATTKLSGAGASLTYTVSNTDCGFGLGTAPNNELACKTVVFNLTYPD